MKQLELACRDGRVSVDEHKNPIRNLAWRGKKRDGCSEADREPCADAAALPKPQQPRWFSSCCYSMPAASYSNPTVDRVALFHYATKSWEDFEVKMARGSGMSTQDKDSSYFDAIKRCAPLAPVAAAVLFEDSSYFDAIKRCAPQALTTLFCCQPLWCWRARATLMPSSGARLSPRAGFVVGRCVVHMFEGSS